MKQSIIRIFLSLLLLIVPFFATAQLTQMREVITGNIPQIKGFITDSQTGEPLSFISVFYEGKGVGGISNGNGEYSIDAHKGWNEITFSAIGYITQVIKLNAGQKVLNVKLVPADIQLSEVIIKPTKEKYSRKNNPAVEFMKKVIAHKSSQRLEQYDYYQYDKYQKMKTSLNDVTEESLKSGIYKKFAFLKDQIEISPESQKRILPFSVQETASQKIYRKEPHSEKTLIQGMNNNGIEEFFSTGDMVGTILNEVFADINIYDNDIKLMKRRFVSPISDGATSFYKFYLMDTLQVNNDRCIHLSFVPNNSQDFGFTGHLYVLADSSFAVKRCTMNLPKKTGVNFVENLNIVQQYQQLPNGTWALTDDDMVVELGIGKSIQGVEVRRTTKYTNYSFNPIEQRLFRIKGDVIKDTDMLTKDEQFWANVRQVPLTQQESTMDLFMKKLEEIPGFKYIIFGAKALIENYVETGSRKNPSKFDFGPINTTVTSNFIDGTRFRLSGQTTAALNPHWFFGGYGAYGIKDQRWKYEGNVTYSFHKCEFFPWEFPKHNISASYRYDVMSPMDKYLDTDKDNVFVSWKASPVDQMSYVRDAVLKYEMETRAGLSLFLMARHRNDEAAGRLEFIRNDADHTKVTDITTSEFQVKLRYAPGESFINTKQRRRPISLDAPIFTLAHTKGFEGVLGGDYDFNLTELSIWKRFWFSSWGKMHITLKGGVQWDKVPFPLLIMPEANLSYITQKETFNLINNMEFLNDKFASLMLTYDMNGKFFNRIPLIKKLKWREVFRFRMLYGTLSDKNNPYKNEGLFLFPTRNGEPTSFVMDKNQPYMEASIGIYNIFKLLHVEYVRRLNYLDNPGINKDGIRFMIQLVF